MRSASPSLCESPTQEALSAYVRLGTKYGMETLVSQSLSYLSSRFPEDFDTWLEWDGCVPFRTHRDLAEYLITILDLAHLTQYKRFVPAALLLACTVRETRLLDGFTLPDGTTGRLCTEDVARVMVLNGELGARLPVMLWELLEEFSSPYTCVRAPGECSAIMKLPAFTREMRKRILRRMRSSEYPLPKWDAMEDVVYRQGVCRDCNACLAINWQQKLREVWLSLPDILNLRDELPDWSKGGYEEGPMDLDSHSDADLLEVRTRLPREGGQSEADGAVPGPIGK